MQPAVRAHYKLEELWTAPLARKRVGAASAVPQYPAADESGGAIPA
jgi:hypothetical protein